MIFVESTEDSALQNSSSIWYERFINPLRLSFPFLFSCQGVDYAEEYEYEGGDICWNIKMRMTDKKIPDGRNSVDG